MITLLWRALLDWVTRTLAGRWREILIEFEGLPNGIRALAVLGYVVILVLIGLTLFFELAGDKLTGIAFKLTAEQYQIPMSVLVVASVAFAVGWALVMTGASDFPRRLFIPVVGLYALQLFILLGAIKSETAWVSCLLLWFVVDVLVVAIGLHALTARAAFWRQYPLVEFGAWLGVSGIFLIVLWVSSGSPGAIASALSGVLALLELLSLTFWIILSLDTINLSLSVARSIVSFVAHQVSIQVLCLAMIVLLVVRPILALILIGVSGDGFWAVDGINSIPLILAMMALALFKRWEKPYILTLLVLGIASPIITLGISLAFKGHDWMELVFSSTGIFPPVLLFVALLSYNVLTLGTQFANVDGRWMPRTGRVLTYFGVVILVMSSVIFSVNRRLVTTHALDETTQTLINSLLALSILGLGPFYVLRLIWKRRGRLVGEETAAISG